MRLVKKYNKYSNLELSPYIPSRILKFRRPKWKFFQKIRILIQKKKFLNPWDKISSSNFKTTLL